MDINAVYNPLGGLYTQKLLIHTITIIWFVLYHQLQKGTAIFHLPYTVSSRYNGTLGTDKI